MKRKSVVFLPTGGAVIKINGDPLEMSKLGIIVDDPDLSLVKRLPPEMWMLENGQVVPKRTDPPQIVEIPQIIEKPSLKQRVLRFFGKRQPCRQMRRARLF